MGKYALLVGVGKYGAGLQPLPAAPNDVAALAKVLSNPQMGGFDEVRPVVNPIRGEMEREIELWFQGRNPDDLVLLFFSGHGLKDDRRDLYFAARNTEKQHNRLIRSTATSARFLHDCIRSCKANCQVLILDCCFSGAFGDVLAKDDRTVELKEQLSAEGRVVLTSTSAVDYSFEEKGSGLSIYTRYLVEGIASGAADEDEDGTITVDELHRYAGRKVEETSPAMSPKIITLKDEGYRIRLARSPQDDPKLKYRKEVERRATAGRFTIPAQRLLISLRQDFGISDTEAQAIEAEVLKPHQEYQRKRKEYDDTLRQSLQAEPTLSLPTIRDLIDFRAHLRLKPEDVVSIEQNALNGYDLESYTAEIERQRQQAEALQRQQAKTTRQQQAEAKRRHQEQEAAARKQQEQEAQQRQRLETEQAEARRLYSEQEAAARQQREREAQQRQRTEAERLRRTKTLRQPTQTSASSGSTLSRRQVLIGGGSLLGLLATFGISQVFQGLDDEQSSQSSEITDTDDAQAAQANSSNDNQPTQADYTQLEELLRDGQWQEADQETENLMLKVADREDEGWLDSDSINAFPCEVLREIDRLWVEYSDGKFGFSVQSQIYFNDCNGDPSGAYDEEAWLCFAERVGWRVNGAWISYLSVTFSTEAPLAHLPASPRLPFKWLIGDLFSRAAICEL